MEINLSTPMTAVLMVSVIIGFFMVLAVLCICGAHIDNKREMKELEEIAERAIRKREKAKKEERQQARNGNCYQNGGQIYSIMHENRTHRYGKSYSHSNFKENNSTTKKVKHFQSYRKHKIMQAKLARKSFKQAQAIANGGQVT